MMGRPGDSVLSFIGPSSPLWGLCWKFISPAIGVLIMVFTLMRGEFTVEHRNQQYKYPTWAIGFGWFLSLVPLVPIPIFFILNLLEFRRRGKPFRKLFTIQPSLVSYNRVIGISQFGIRPKYRDEGSPQSSASFSVKSIAQALS
ncbi:unnamed protein product [Heligmosomoides polygyrus]|uniref:G_PROTEIN_RECEP_F2_4 domain-containing protein n=1 Tax=Heligmosomoides polygyrus TaxID=6339 RepID=A0A183F3J8_HELPZ|nr:unnamed protein product [Heligmosomoides polygyrus]